MKLSSPLFLTAIAIITVAIAGVTALSKPSLTAQVAKKVDVEVGKTYVECKGAFYDPSTKKDVSFTQRIFKPTKKIVPAPYTTYWIPFEVDVQIDGIVLPLIGKASFPGQRFNEKTIVGRIEYIREIPKRWLFETNVGYPKPQGEIQVNPRLSAKRSVVYNTVSRNGTGEKELDCKEDFSTP